jgi:hypothetical protein
VKAFPQGRRRSRLSCSTGANLGAVRETPGFAQKTKNRGNEAKESLKTKEVAKTRCAKRTHIYARKAANEAKKAARVAHTCRRFLSACMHPPGPAGRRHAKERHVYATRGGMEREGGHPQNATPSPVALRLMKAPERDTLSPKGAREVGVICLLPTAHCLLPTCLLPMA